MTKLLIAGGAGYIGSKLVPELLKRGYDLDVADLLWFGNNLPKEVRVIKKDIFDLRKKDLEGYDQAIFLGGLSNDPMAEFSPKLNFIHNSALPQYLAFQSKEAGIKKFIYASSCSIYGYTQDKLFDENSPTTCGYPYGISKLQGENGCMQLQDKDFSVISLRQGTMGGFSPRMRTDLVVNAMFKNSILEQKLTVNNPSIWRPLCDIRDATTAYIRAIQADQSVSGIFNIASENYTIGEVGDLVKQEVEKLTGDKIKLTIKDMQDFRNYKISFEKAKIVLGYNPKYGVRDTVEDLYSNLEKIGNIGNPEFSNIYMFKQLKLDK